MKRHPALQPLSREHHGSLALARRILRSDGATTVELATLCAEVARNYFDELQAHFSAEEDMFLPRLRGRCEREASRLVQDHAAMTVLIEPIQAGDADALRAYGRLLAEHVRFEERELFPLIEDALPASWQPAETRHPSDVQLQNRKAA